MVMNKHAHSLLLPRFSCPLPAACCLLACTRRVSGAVLLQETWWRSWVRLVLANPL